MVRQFPARVGMITVLAAAGMVASAILIAAAASTSGGGAAYLFTQPYSSGTLTGPGDTDLTLTLSGLRSYMTAFTDRPDRRANLISYADVYRLWPTWFGGDPPNAALTYVPAGEERPVTVILELRDPRYSPAAGTVTYRAAKIPKSETRFPGAEVAVSPLPGDPNLQNHVESFGAGVLFIDDYDSGSYLVPTMPPFK